MAGLGFKAVVASVFFMVLNITINVYCKWLFAPWGGYFAFPWSLLAFQQLQTWLVLQLWFMLYEDRRQWGWGLADAGITWHDMMRLWLISVFFCLNVGLNAVSLVDLSITLNQTVRAFQPVAVLMFSGLVEQRPYPLWAWGTSAILIVGILLSCYNAPSFDLFPFCCVVLSTLVAALGSSLTGRMLHSGPFSGSGRVQILRLMMFQSVLSLLMMTPTAVLLEGHVVEGIMVKCRTCSWLQYRGHIVLGLASISTVIALITNLSRCFLVAITSALSETLVGNAKVAALCLVDAHLFGTVLQNYNYAGVGLTFLGFSLHSVLQYQESAMKSMQGSVESDEPCNSRGLSLSAGQEGNSRGSPIRMPRALTWHHGLSPGVSMGNAAPLGAQGLVTGQAAELLAVHHRDTKANILFQEKYATLGSLAEQANSPTRPWSIEGTDIARLWSTMPDSLDRIDKKFSKESCTSAEADRAPLLAPLSASSSRSSDPSTPAEHSPLKISRLDFSGVEGSTTLPPSPARESERAKMRPADIHR